MELPLKISPCPIIDALVEVRFTSNKHPNSIFGLVYNDLLAEDYPKVENLPISQLPDNVRKGDPNLKHKPFYKISNENFIIQFGPEVFAIASHPEYVGWKSFSSEINRVMDILKSSSVVNQILRLGIRYINFFEEDVFENAKINISLGNIQSKPTNALFRTEISHKNFKSTLQAANNATTNGKVGSIIDIDTFTNSGLKNFFEDKEEIISEAHLEEKGLFFSLLKEDFIQKFNPEY